MWVSRQLTVALTRLLTSLQTVDLIQNLTLTVCEDVFNVPCKLTLPCCRDMTESTAAFMFINASMSMISDMT